VFVERTLQLSVAISVSLSVLLAADNDSLNYLVLDVSFAARAAVAAVLIVVLVMRLLVVYNSIFIIQHRFSVSLSVWDLLPALLFCICS